MKKLLNALRSMRFGILLLALIGLLSLVGSILPQEREAAWYAQAYPGLHSLLLFLQLHRVYKSWYFLLLLALLGLNLTLCSLLRVVSLVKSEGSLLGSTAALPVQTRLTPEGLAGLDAHLRARGCRVRHFGGSRVYVKNRLGRYGSFLTHLSILLTLLFGAAALYLPRVIDRDCMPGEALQLADGTQIAVDAFSVERADGRLDYRSELRVTLPDGRESGPRSIRVNHPLRFGPYKIYQQSYGSAGAIAVTNRDNGGTDVFLMTDPSFLSLDRQNGLWFLALYPDFFLNAEGDPMPLNVAAREDAQPIYYVQISDEGDNRLGFYFPGDSLEVGKLSFRFEEPVAYPGLRIKHTPAAVSAALIAAFALMVLGLYLTFFLPPVLVKADESGYTVAGPKREGVELELRAVLRETQEEEHA